MSEDIVIFDDEADKAGEWADRLDPLLGDRIKRSPVEDLQESLEILEARRAAVRLGKAIPENKTVFDVSTILIVDYDLFKLDEKQVLSGDRVAYLARCYSNCGLILGVNQDLTSRWFDLTMLDHPEAFTDLSIGSAHLDSKGLWSENTESFQPSHWPNLINAAVDFEKCVEAVEGAGDGTDVLSLLGIDDARRNLLPRDLISQVQKVGATATDQLVATPQELVHQTALGVRLKDEFSNTPWISRIAAARLRKWVDSIVLQRQDLIVDLPHLLARAPGLLSASEDSSLWQQSSARDTPPDGLNIRDVDLAQHLFGWQPWLCRPAWWWPSIASDPSLDGYRHSSVPEDDLVYCEDLSRFAPRAECHRFTSKLGGTFAQRWVRMPDEDGNHVADYEPAMRLAL